MPRCPFSRGWLRSLAVTTRVYPHPMDHYCEAFIAQPGRCWRLVSNPDPGRQGIPDFCLAQPVWRGRHKAGSKWLEVDSCDGHAEGLSGVTRPSRLPRTGT
jgi:hypothetical protein